jgi:hypothetical protein
MATAYGAQLLGRYCWRTREQGEMALEMSDKLQFVAGFCHSPTAESHDKLMVFEN